MKLWLKHFLTLSHKKTKARNLEIHFNHVSEFVACYGFPKNNFKNLLPDSSPTGKTTRWIFTFDGTIDVDSSTVIETTKYSSWVVQICHKENPR